MRKKTKVVLVLIALVSILCCVPVISNAAEPVTDEATLRDAIANANPGDTITLANDITIKSTLTVTNEVTIDGAGFTVKADESWTGGSGDQSMFTSSVSGNLTLKNITLEGGPKYGVQAFGGAKAVLDGVKIYDCAFGGILLNGGTIEIKDVYFGPNGATGNNLIEIDQGSTTEVPKLIMNGDFKTSQSGDIINLATNGNLKEYSVENTDSSIYKVYATGNKVVVTGVDDRVLYTSNENDSAAFAGDAANEKVVLTLDTTLGLVERAVNKGATLSAADVEDMLVDEGLVTDEFVVSGFYSNETFTKEFDFAQPMDANTTIYVYIEEVKTEDPDNTVDEENKDEKDETPKTGVENFLGIAIATIVIGTMAVVVLKRKNA